jgi:hypothetical protein
MTGTMGVNLRGRSGEPQQSSGYMKTNGTSAARRFFPSVSQQDTCHPEAKRGISFTLSAIDLNRDVTKD